MLSRLVTVAGVGALVSVLALGWRFAIFVLPFGWTGEPERLVRLLRLEPGGTVADIGAGDGTLAVEMARRVGPTGLVYATELSPERRDAIAKRAAESSLTNIRVVAAAVDGTRLPDGCCDAVYLRTVLHHIDDRPAYARDLLRAVRPGGRLAIIDFAPGSLWFHLGDHGVDADEVMEACRKAGFEMVERVDSWGGGTYALVFERHPQRFE